MSPPCNRHHRLGSDSIALVERTRRIGRLTTFVEKSAKKRGGELRRVRMGSHPAAYIKGPPIIAQSRRDVELVSGADARETARIDAGERAYHLPVGRRPFAECARR